MITEDINQIYINRKVGVDLRELELHTTTLIYISKRKMELNPKNGSWVLEENVFFYLCVQNSFYLIIYN